MISLIECVNGSWLSRGPRPSSQLDMATIKAPTIINLETGWFELLHQRDYEEETWANSLNIAMIHYPLSDLTAPTRKQVDEVHRLIALGLKHGAVHFHCLHGEDRTGYIAASWRILQQGWAPDKAIEEMYSMGFHKFPYFYWVPSLRALK